MNPEIQKLIQDNHLHIQTVKGWIADVRHFLHHHEAHPTSYVPLGTTEQENASLPPDLAQSFGYIEINYLPEDLKEAA
jgi:hypothetical protein